MTVFASNIAIVIGPTPPGTGVMAAARAAAGAYSTSPSSLPSAVRLMPTSITTAPGLTHSPRIISARPTAATSRSARPTVAARSRVFEWQTVTVASAPSSSAAIGLPTMFDRPTTTAFAPASGRRASSISFITPKGVQATKRGSPMQQAANVLGVNAVDVLARIDGEQHAPRVDAGGQRQLDQDAVDAAVGVQRRDDLQELVGGRRGGQPVVEGLDAGLRAGGRLVAHVDLGRRIVADEDDGQPRRDSLRGQAIDLQLQVAAHARGQRFSVKNRGGHREAP